MNPHELTTVDLRAEITYRRRNLELLRSSSDPADRPASPHGLEELEHRLGRYEAELRRRERYTNEAR